MVRRKKLGSTTATYVPQVGRPFSTGSVRADLGNETWGGTGRVVRMSMFPLADGELRDVLDPERPSCAPHAAGDVERGRSCRSR